MVELQQILGDIFGKRLKPWEVEIEVPSGRLIFRNDMRDLFPTTEERFNVNLTSGKKRCEEHYAELGMFHIYVGNTCPGIYQFEDRLVVGRYDDEVWNSKTEEYEEIECPEKENLIGGICTDLWWFSACDYDKFIKRGGGVNKDWPADVIVDVEPGRYKLTSYYSVSGMDEINDYAVIVKV